MIFSSLLLIKGFKGTVVNDTYPSYPLPSLLPTFLRYLYLALSLIGAYSTAPGVYFSSSSALSPPLLDSVASGSNKQTFEIPLKIHAFS